VGRPLGLVLLDEFGDETLEEVIALVSRTLGADVGLLGRAECEAGFDRDRGQWRADLMIERCLERYSSPGRLCLGLTSKDLYVPSLNFVFGLALRNQGLALVSWHRLREQEGVPVARLCKEMVHEVGHLEGLDHCSNESCVMWFSNTLGETDRKEVDFCPACNRKRGRP
jgi:archaemetzincin